MGDNTGTMTCRPFISYAREDVEVARRLCRDLEQLGAQPWLDVHDLVGGQEWEHAIEDAIRGCTHVIALMSRHSINKRGYVQRELRHAINVLEELPPGSVFLVPLRLDDTEPRHQRLKELHWIDFTGDYALGLTRLGESLDLVRTRIDPLAEEVPTLQHATDVNVAIEAIGVSPQRLTVLASREAIYAEAVAFIRSASINAVVRATATAYSDESPQSDEGRTYLGELRAKARQAANMNGAFRYVVVVSYRRTAFGLAPTRIETMIRARAAAFDQTPERIVVCETSEVSSVDVLIVGQGNAIIAFPGDAGHGRWEHGLSVRGEAFVQPLIRWYDDLIFARAAEVKITKR
jgi:hypothetical protein